jgi:adenylosuccinate lyase
MPPLWHERDISDSTASTTDETSPPRGNVTFEKVAAGEAAWHVHYGMTSSDLPDTNSP